MPDKILMLSNNEETHKFKDAFQDGIKSPISFDKQL
jgi:hypothetical protein